MTKAVNLSKIPSNITANANTGNLGVGASETSLFNGVGGTAKLVVTGSDSATAVTDNSGAALVIANTDDTANNLAGLHFAWQDTDNSPNYAAASIVAVLGTKVAGQYPAGQLVFNTSSATNNAPSEKMRIDSAGDLKFNSGYGSVATAYGCRAWVNFNGTGTVAIRASGNVSSITDNGAGDYTVNFTTAMPDANYSVAGSAKEADSGTTDTLFKIAEVASNPAAGSVRVISGGASSAWDSNTVMVSVFR